MKEIQQIIGLLLPHGPMDAVGVGIIDFKTKTFEALEAVRDGEAVKFSSEPAIYYDLASVTKPLTSSISYFLRPELFDEKMLLCLSHRGGLPAWGLLPADGWRQQVLGYPVKESETLYSDFSVLRVMLELEKKGVQMKELCSPLWDKELVHWLDLPPGAPLLQYGYKNGQPSFGEVHDPNAWVLGGFCSHAGLFATVPGLCRTLLAYQAKLGFIQKVKDDLQGHSQRFALGWDRVVNPQETLAGKGCGKFTFGFLGFTGTSLWIDPEKERGYVLLTNAVKHHWFDKQILNDLRRAVGELVWAR